MLVNEQGLAELARTLTNQHFLDLVDACHLSYPEPSMDSDVLAALDLALHLTSAWRWSTLDRIPQRY